jgi:hypothetical protein
VCNVASGSNEEVDIEGYFPHASTYKPIFIKSPTAFEGSVVKMAMYLSALNIHVVFYTLTPDGKLEIMTYGPGGLFFMPILRIHSPLNGKDSTHIIYLRDKDGSAPPST